MTEGVTGRGIGHPADPAEVSAGARYAERLARLAAAGHDLHGEARFCADLLARAGPPGRGAGAGPRTGPRARILDAGCGTGRVAAQLAELGFDCAGTDLDPSMHAEARRLAPGVPWVLADLAALDLPAAGVAEPFDLAVMAGNVVPLAGKADVPAVLARLAAHLRPGGLLVAGFGLDAANLPGGVVPVPLGDYDRAAAAAGLALHERYATWDAEPYAGGGYAVSVHRRAGSDASG